VAQRSRRHLRLLLIDFLGQQVSPSDAEALLMQQALKSPRERAVAFRAMSGSSGWFRQTMSRHDGIDRRQKILGFTRPRP
jgi:hypothetical protein